jgi:TPR repeat protein
MLRLLCCCCAASLLLGGTASADLEAGLAAYRAGDYQTAYEHWLPQAEGGSTEAQFNLGLLHEHGLGRPVDLERAMKWYLRSADGGFARAQYRVAEIYESGEGVERDPVQAYKWFKLAAAQRYEDARKRRKKLADGMTSTEIALGEMWVREWKKARRSGPGEAD